MTDSGADLNESDSEPSLNLTNVEADRTVHVGLSPSGAKDALSR